MPRDTDDIERDITRAREELATTFDTLAVRASPQRLADDAKSRALVVLDTPAVKYTLIGVGALVAALVVKKLVS
ncbi:DUF3618 domain-containing protein [Williamsia sterculiae]|uniref:DUF3618 domain-containing protein n=1 Tax=Williamsia sterculiae TaxID=1344003 RepID=A0A1N7GKM0_9NOCA|nr:DUF3618 domain-containing protein [Williamsia sterculiae]SIS13144.1 Protein of unknown function [Williamsia sterculiae]